jgi:DNA-binding MarR family transcriptional regulator
MTNEAYFENLPVRRLPVARFNKQVNLALTRLLKAAKSDLSREQEVILRQLRIRDSISQITLSTLVDQDSNNMSRTLSLLQSRGFVRRVASQTDRRSQNVEITAEGIAAHTKAFKSIDAYWNISFKGFTEDETQIFGDLMRRMTKNLSDYMDNPEPDNLK